VLWRWRGHGENDSNNKVNSLQRLDIEFTNIFPLLSQTPSTAKRFPKTIQKKKTIHGTEQISVLPRAELPGKNNGKMGNKRGQFFKEARNFRSNTQKDRRKALFLKRHRMNEITEPAHHLQF
jgi:hypothetical protein